MLGTQRCDDELIVYTLIQIRTLTTGRARCGNVPRRELTDDELIDELIDFWADPSMEAQA